MREVIISAHDPLGAIPTSLTLGAIPKRSTARAFKMPPLLGTITKPPVPPEPRSQKNSEAEETEHKNLKQKLCAVCEKHFSFSYFKKHICKISNLFNFSDSFFVQEEVPLYEPSLDNAFMSEKKKKQKKIPKNKLKTNLIKKNTGLLIKSKFG